MHDPVIRIQNVTFRYPCAARHALRDFSLEVGEGEFLLVTGVSGSGKSTLLRMLNGLVPHFHGGNCRATSASRGATPLRLDRAK